MFVITLIRTKTVSNDTKSFTTLKLHTSKKIRRIVRTITLSCNFCIATSFFTFEWTRAAVFSNDEENLEKNNCLFVISNSKFFTKFI